jgi:hypothetical protein
MTMKAAKSSYTRKNNALVKHIRKCEGHVTDLAIAETSPASIRDMLGTLWDVCETAYNVVVSHEGEDADPTQEEVGREDKLSELSRVAS